MHIIFICTGNICRSPFAEYTAKKIALAQNRDDLVFSSMGIQTHNGLKSDDMSIQCARQFAIDLSPHTSQKIDLQAIYNADLVLGMEENHIRYIHDFTNNNCNHVELLLNYPKKRWFRNPNIFDPYKKSEAHYLKAYQQIHQQLEKLIPKL